MTDVSHKPVTLSKPGLLRWEIGLALLIKVVLLTALWFLIFRWVGKPHGKPDIAGHFALTRTQTAAKPGFSPQALKETPL